MLHGVPESDLCKKPQDLHRHVLSIFRAAEPSVQATSVTAHLIGVSRYGKPANGKRPILLQSGSQTAKHLAFKLSSRLRNRGYSLADELTPKQLQAQRDLEPDFAALKSGGLNPFFRGAQLHYSDKGLLKTCAKGQASRMTSSRHRGNVPVRRSAQAATDMQGVTGASRAAARAAAEGLRPQAPASYGVVQQAARRFESMAPAAMAAQRAAAAAATSLPPPPPRRESAVPVNTLAATGPAAPTAIAAAPSAVAAAPTTIAAPLIAAAPTITATAPTADAVAPTTTGTAPTTTAAAPTADAEAAAPTADAAAPTTTAAAPAPTAAAPTTTAPAPAAAAPTTTAPAPSVAATDAPGVSPDLPAGPCDTVLAPASGTEATSPR